MLTLVETISLAGDRAKQNDDALGYTQHCAWVIDGATDLHDAPLTKTASDASWIAHFANTFLHGASGELRERVRMASVHALQAFAARSNKAHHERWQSPIASLIIALETEAGLSGLDLGDCRVFTLDALGAVAALGGPEDAADAESRLAAGQTDKEKPLLQRADTITKLRELRAAQNGGGGSWTFGLNPECAEHARAWRIPLARPAHILLMTDGFSALADRYGAYDPGGLVRAALEQGLQALGAEVRAIENADAASSRHPRFKKSDDATALLLRLT